MCCLGIELQVKKDRLVAQLDSDTSDCDSWGSLARKTGVDIINLLPLLDKSKNQYELLEG